MTGPNRTRDKLVKLVKTARFKKLILRMSLRITSRQTACYSGYFIETEMFKAFIDSLCKTNIRSEPLLDHYVDAYDKWRLVQLTPSEVGMAPKLREHRTKPYSTRLSQAENAQAVDKLFFVLRYATIKNRVDLSRPDFVKRVSEERETDGAILARFEELVEKHGGSLDRAQLKFGYMLDVHPSCDDRIY